MATINLWIALIGECEFCGSQLAVTHDVCRGDKLKCPACRKTATVGGITQSCKDEKKKTFEAELAETIF